MEGTSLYFAKLKLNGRFTKNYKKDMEKESLRLDFMRKYGDPLDGLDLSKPVVLWYPTYFTVVRIFFALTTMFLWEKPMILLVVRLVTDLIKFTLVSLIQPHENKTTTKMELLSEATSIVLIVCIIQFTDLLNEGNINDANGGNTPDLQ